MSVKKEKSNIQENVPKIPLKNTKRRHTENLSIELRSTARVNIPTTANKDRNIASSRSLEPTSIYTVGLKKGKNTLQDSQYNLKHFRNIVESKTSRDKIISVYETLKELLKNIPLDTYSKSTPTQKLMLIKECTEAYNFAWNEATLQLKGISEDYALFFIKTRNFYLSLVDKYPELMNEFQAEVDRLIQICEEKDQIINITGNEIEQLHNKLSSINQYIATIQSELVGVRAEKEEYKKKNNNLLLEIENLKMDVTELKCQLVKSKDESGKVKREEKIKLEESLSFCSEVDHVDTGVDSVVMSFTRNIHPGEGNGGSMTFINQNNSGKTSKSNLHKDISDTEYGFVYNDETELDLKFAPLRHTIFKFAIKLPPAEEHIKLGVDGEFKRFFWLFPKVCSILVNGLANENPKQPFTSFDKLCYSFFSEQYKTEFLTQQIFASVVATAHLLEQSNTGIKLFNKFIRCEYDFAQYRFTSSVTEFSLCYSCPNISELIVKEFLSPEDVVCTISRENAKLVHEAVFPFYKLPEEFENQQNIDFWVFQDYLILTFDKARRHLWAIAKNALLLSDCTDVNNITLTNFTQAMCITLPEVPHTDIESLWETLVVREKAINNHHSGCLSFDSIVFLFTSKDAFIHRIMKIKTHPNFEKIFFNWNVSTLEILSFIVKRITNHIPLLTEYIPVDENILREINEKIRVSLFLADLSGAACHYRKLLYIIDEFFVNDFSNIHITNQSTMEQVQALTDHLIQRERVVGIVDGK